MRKTFKAIRQAWLKCELCPLYENRNRSVSHRFVGAPEPGDLMLIGEGPGARENEQGKPFVGPSGLLLDKLLKQAEIDHATIINMVACKPPMNRNPKRSELETCWPRVVELIGEARPRAIVSLGRVATDRLLKHADRTDVGTAYLLSVASNFISVVPTYHPAYLLRKSKDNRLRFAVVDHLRFAAAIVEELPF